MGLQVEMILVSGFLGFGCEKGLLVGVDRFWEVGVVSVVCGLQSVGWFIVVDGGFQGDFMFDIDVVVFVVVFIFLLVVLCVFEICFMGFGSEYFCIWVVNLLFIFCMLGLYLFFVKVWCICYFYVNILVDGQVLSFYGDLWKMFCGFLLLVVLMGLYGGFSIWLLMFGGLVFVVLVLMWLLLWCVGMCFWLLYISWCGLCFGFFGDVVGVYWIFLFVSLLFIVVMLVLEDVIGFWFVFVGIVGLVLNFMLVWMFGLVKCYQYNYFCFG